MRSSARMLILVVALIAAGVGAAWPWFTASDDAALRVQEAGGEVLRDRAGAATPAEAGAVLEAGDRVSTGVDGFAVLGRPDGASVRLGGGTSVQIAAVADDALEIELERGQVRARVRRAGETVVVGNQGRRVSATSGEVAMSVTADGVLGAQASDGAEVSGVVGVTSLASGERVVVAADGAAAAFRPSAEPLLDVRWPGPTAETRVSVVGTTEPGATVRFLRPAGPVEVRADNGGQFELALDLVEGEQEVEVLVTDLFGGTRRATAKIVRDTKGPAVKVQLDYGRR
jgi:hypothetical protein